MAKWTRNHMMEIGIVLAVIGLLGTIIAFTDHFASTTPGWLQPYHDLTHRAGENGGNYNLILLIAAPIILIIGGFYVGEQLVLRRRFERLLDTPRRSEFASRRRDLEDLSKRLPEGYAKRITEKESEFVSRRSA